MGYLSNSCFHISYWGSYALGISGVCVGIFWISNCFCSHGNQWLFESDGYWSSKYSALSHVPCIKIAVFIILLYTNFQNISRDGWYRVIRHVLSPCWHGGGRGVGKESAMSGCRFPADEVVKRPAHAWKVSPARHNTVNRISRWGPNTDTASRRDNPAPGGVNTGVWSHARCVGRRRVPFCEFVRSMISL